MYTRGLWAFGNATAHEPDDFCQTAFGVSKAQTRMAIAASNAHYGGRAPNATRIMWPNGEVDPWSSLSVLTQTNPAQPTLMVAGASHHEWTHPALPTDLPSIVAARAAIRKQVAAWLQDA